MLSRTILRTVSRQCSRVGARTYSSMTEPTPPPLLLKVRKDLKDAMRRNDTNKLSVVRTLLAQTQNASKTNSPIVTDMHMLALIRKNRAAAKTAAEEFKAAKRDDLAEKELAQVKVYDEYAGGVEVVSEEDVRNAITKIVEDINASGEKPNAGQVMKKVLSPEAGFEGKNLDKALVAKVVKEIISAQQ